MDECVDQLTATSPSRRDESAGESVNGFYRPVRNNQKRKMGRKCTWNPLERFTSFLVVSEPESASESSSALTFLEVFVVLGLAFFFAGAAFRVLAPRVGRARMFSSACNLAAKRASASTSFPRFCFLDGGLVSSGTSDSSSLSAGRFFGEAECVEDAGSGGVIESLLFSWPLIVSTLDAVPSAEPPVPPRLAKMSNRSMISCLMAA